MSTDYLYPIVIGIGFLSMMNLGFMSFVNQKTAEFYLRWFGSKKKTESLIPEKGIRIINIETLGSEISEEDLTNYLEHHLNEAEPNFEKVEFDNPIYVRFKYLNEIYQMCLNGLQSTRDEHKPFKTTPKYLSAVIKHNGDEMCVTEKIREFHGHSRNFFDHIPDVVNDLNFLLKDHQGELHTFDMMGNVSVHKLD